MQTVRSLSGQPFPRMREGHPGWTIDPGYNSISSSYGGISSLVPSPAGIWYAAIKDLLPN